MLNEMWKLDATAQAELVASGQVTPLELVDAAIARVERLNPAVHAVVGADFDRARERARTAPTGRLGGVPFLVKDLTPYPGFRHAMGSRLFADNRPAESTPYSEALDAAGLVVLGKTTTSELGLLGSTETLLDGTTYNPWDRTRSAGGSSGGAAAAVACRMVPMAHASDGGGSIRIPAAMNGVFGLKPGGDRIAPSIPDDMQGLVVDHCVSWSVRDSALLFSLTERGGDDAVGFVSEPQSRRLRIGVYRDTLVGDAPEEAQRMALEKTATLCRELGHEVVDIAPPPIDGPAVSAAFFTLAGATLAQLSQMLAPMLGRPLGEGDFEPFTLALIDWFRELPDDALPTAMATVEQSVAVMGGYLAEVDVSLCPTIPVGTFPLGTLAPTKDRIELITHTESLAGYTPVHNMAKVPAMSVPLHMDDSGLPIGSHFAAARGREATLFALAYELEAAAPWKDRIAAPVAEP